MSIESSMQMSDLCRLCMASEFLFDLLTSDGDTNLSIKISSCVGIQIIPDDGMPSLICKDCKEIINMFCNFKQKCLEVDSKLRSLANSRCLNVYNNDINIEIPRRCLDVESNYDNQTPNNSNIIQNLESKVEESPIYPRKKYNLCIGGGNQNNKYKNKHTDDFKSTLSNKFQCEICGRIFKIKTRLDNHLLTHSGLKPYQCKLCPKRYCRTESVMIHMRTHAGIKPYVCEICGKTSTKRQDLIRHMKIHSEERNYGCPTCDRHFKRASDVSSHMRTHTGSRPYHCKTCKKSYASHSGLRKHYKSLCKNVTAEVKLK